MTVSQNYQPLLELVCGPIAESLHFGAFAVVDSRGNLLAAQGDPNTITFLRSSAKPFQTLPLIENQAHIHWKLTEQEIAITCASHAGTDAHATTVQSILAKINASEANLLCGTHPPMDGETRRTLIRRDENPTANRHNCSGKHTGMLAQARFWDLPLENYLDRDHPIQKQIFQTFSEMCDVTPSQVILGTDGCSAPNFAIPLKNAALGFARLCDPHDLPEKRAEACQTITQAMTHYPEMISGPGRFDTRLMEVTGGKLVVKGGAEGYQCIGLMPGAIRPGSPGIGIALKISDGDLKGRARPAVSLEILRQLGAISVDELAELTKFGPNFDLYNWRKIHVGAARPVFIINKP